MSNKNRHFYTRPELPESVIIDLKGRKVGSEDLATAGLMLKWCENEGYRGTSLRIAQNIAMGLEVAIELALRGRHEEAAKKAGDVMWVLKKDRENSKARNYKALGNISIECRDGQYREVGAVVKWFMTIHFRIAEQVKSLVHVETETEQQLAFEAEMFKQSVLDGKAAQEAAEGNADLSKVA